jgi:hypothetical protein
VTRRRLRYAATLPERTLRALAATVGGSLHEAAELLLPRFVRRSRFYEATAKNALRIAIELVGGVDARAPAEAEALPAPDLARRKAAGNVVELGSIAAFGFSPLWLLAAAADVLHGSRVYLEELVSELERAGVLAPGSDVGSVDDLLSALEGTSGTAARLVDIPPLELAGLRATLEELREDAGSLPTPGELAAVYDGVRRAAAAERKPLLDVSTGMGLAFALSARNVARRHVATPYVEDWRPLRDEGFGTYARRVSEPYRFAAAGHFDPGRRTLTDRALDRLARRGGRR